MNKFLTILAAISLTASTFAQAPEKMSYQAVIRDSGNTTISNQAVGMQISILQTTAAGTAVYVETQSPTTNANGLVSIQIGMGSVVSGDFSAIDWSAGPYFIKTETDPTGGTNYTITGTSELLSVPYALHAKTAESLTNSITELASFRIMNYSAIQANATSYVQLANTGDFMFNPNIFELQNSGNYGVKIKKDGFLNVSINQAVITTTSGYITIRVFKNGNLFGAGVISGTNGSLNGIDVSVPLKVFENDIITIQFLQIGGQIQAVYSGYFSVYSFSWYQN